MKNSRLTVFLLILIMEQIDNHILRVKDITKPFDFDLSRPLEIEVGCGKGKFLTERAKQNPDCDFLGIERMLERVRLFDGKCRRGKIDNAKVLRLEALYTFHYLLPDHHARTVYVFFPDPWPKKKHHSHRLFGPLFLNALWKRLEIGGKLEFATDHEEYFHTVEEPDWQPDYTVHTPTELLELLHRLNDQLEQHS